jgi:hypothetical protein
MADADVRRRGLFSSIPAVDFYITALIKQVYKMSMMTA